LLCVAVYIGVRATRVAERPLMSQLDSLPSDSAAIAVSPEANIAAPKKKGRKKLRGVWISFVGRIVAQFVGSAATIVLALMFLQKYQANSRDTVDRAPQSRTAVTAASATEAPRERRHPSEKWLAVLPLENLSGDPAQDHLARAMTEALITALSQVEGLRVISRTSSTLYKGASRPLPEIARELAVDWVLEGSIVLSAGRVRVIGQLIDGTTDEHIWAASYDRQFRDPLSLQTTFASAIARDVDNVIVRGKRGQAGPSPADEPRRQDLDEASPEDLEASEASTRP
jgi:TolB-like protein